MDTRQEIREFLTSRRARVTPEAAGIPASTGTRRVPGLRREEAATLAGVSVDYYTRLERGTVTGVSDAVLDGVCRALALDDAERAHLIQLVRGSRALGRGRGRPSRRVSSSVQRMLDNLPLAPAFVSNSRLDLVATNALCAALYADLTRTEAETLNLARFTFLDPRALTFYPEWDVVAEMTVALLRSSAGSDPMDRELTGLIGELVTRSDEFRTRWADHDVRRHTSGTKRFDHPVVGELELAFDSLTVAADPSLTVTVYTAEPGSRSHDALRLLASWSVDDEQAHAPLETSDERS